ncbi:MULTISPECIES: TonB-dependent receptor domain-containing protein [Glaesserella]|uniref:Outer membrane colicin Js receptor n=1 Tax=Glaesserella australis TaxID=2094024 RepID=A0A328C226_9PAST|nr:MULTISPECIES: TonB-dependent receptor [Glaesserella]AUI66779.1 outer membrane colicin Js receptor [Glaesserella sp. 15-184]RAL19831.1 outer membrane colicin Js receptor [Glaesserella australis]
MKQTYIALAVSQAVLMLAFPVMATDTMALSEVVVVADAETESFKKAGAVSSRGAEKRMQSLDSVVRAIPGTYTNIDPTLGTVNVNIRGMSGLGRVNTTIDGVPQTGFGTSANGGSRYHNPDENVANPSSQFGATIDPNFLARIDIERDFAHGASGVNNLSGSAEFKTIGVDDVVFSGNQVGVLSKFATGTNAYGYNAMTALAGKTQAFSSTGSVGALFAYGVHKIGSNYKDGNGNRHHDNAYVSRQSQRPTSWLGKVEINPTEQQKLLFSGRDYTTNIGGRELAHRNWSMSYDFNANSYLNLALLASHTRNKQTFNPDASIWALVDSRTHNHSNFFKLENKSFIDLGEVDLTLTAGASHFTNSYQRIAKYDENYSSLDSTPFAPSGEQKITAGFIETDWKKGIYRLEAGLIYARSGFSGFKPACGEVEGVPIPCFPSGAMQIKKYQNSLNPSIRLSAEMNDWFTPFVSYSKSSRMPNIQELFFNNEGGGSMNPHLKPEKAKTYQIGFNSFKHNVFTEQDKLGLKVSHFRKTVRNFIISENFYISSAGTLTNDINQAEVAGFNAQIAVNSLEPIKMSGTEIELNYDNGSFFSRLAYAHQKTSQPIGIQSSVEGFGYGDIYELPKHTATLDIGTKLFNQKLTLGSIIKYTGTAYRILPLVDLDNPKPRKQKLPNQPVVADFYAIYDVNKHFKLKFSVQNAFDAAYVDPLNSQNGTRGDYDVDENDNDVFKFTNYARGRTFVVGGEVRF